MKNPIQNVYGVHKNRAEDLIKVRSLIQEITNICGNQLKLEDIVTKSKVTV